jgi:hypothetical protein
MRISKRKKVKNEDLNPPPSGKELKAYHYTTRIEIIKIVKKVNLV